jgi:outer membrane immunogenic protein
MKKLLLGASATLLMIASAVAADLPVKARPMVVEPVWSWTGFYVGANIGYGWGRPSGDLVANSGGIAIPPAIAGGTIPTAFGLQSRGVLGGGQLGYNWQINSWVFGLEADYQFADIRRSVAIANPGAGPLLPTNSVASSDLNWFGTFRGRLGYTWNQFLLYGTGGLAYGRFQDNVTVATVPAPPLGVGSSTSTRVGWAAGAGIEWSLAAAWSVKAEYLHVDLGSTVVHASFAPGSPTDFLDYRFRHSDEIVRVGVNYRWGLGPVVAKY